MQDTVKILIDGAEKKAKKHVFHTSCPFLHKQSNVLHGSQCENSILIWFTADVPWHLGSFISQKRKFAKNDTHGPEHLMQNNVESAGDIAYCGNGRTILETELFNYWTITITRTLQQMDGIKALSIWWAFQRHKLWFIIDDFWLLWDFYQVRAKESSSQNR